MKEIEEILKNRAYPEEIICVQRAFGLPVSSYEILNQAFQDENWELGWITAKELEAEGYNPVLAKEIEAFQFSENLLELSEKFFPEEEKIDSLAPTKVTVMKRLSEAQIKFYNDLLKIKDSLDKEPEILVEPDRDGESVVIFLSDLHMGKIVKDKEGKIVFNKDILKERLKKLPGRIKKILERISKGTPITEVILALGGDLVDGEDVYPNHAFDASSHMIEQVKDVTSVLGDIIGYLSRNYRNVVIPTARGNHGKIYRGHKASNWDNAVYMSLEIFVEMNRFKNVKVLNNPELAYNLFEVRGKRILMRHYAPKHDGTAAARDKFGGWKMIHNYDALMYGHWHVWGILNYHGVPLIRNGSLVGGDDFAESLALHDSPRQIIFGVSKKRIPTFIYSIDFT